jgi:hypothetical protein
LDDYKSKGLSGKSGGGLTLHGIYKKNCGFARGHELFNFLKDY